MDEQKAQKELAALSAIRVLGEQTVNRLNQIAKELDDGDAMRRVITHGLDYASHLMTERCPFHGENCPDK